MTLRIQRLLSLLCLCGLSLWPAGLARGQSADEFFHGGAQSYITNNVENARALVDAGLKLYPADEKLKKLDELLKQQQQQQQQQDQNQQQNQNQKQQNQKDQQDQKNQRNQNQPQSKDQQKQDQQKQDQSKQPQKDQGLKDQPKQAQGQKDKQDQQQKPGDDQKDGEQQQASAVPAGQMTPEEAKRLLDAQKGEEKVLVMQPPGKEKPENPEHPHKDW